MSELPPRPDKGQLDRWANQLYEYLVAQTGISKAVEPTPVLLAHKVSGVMARAGTPGVLLYDPVNRVPVFSDGTVFKPLLDTVVEVLLSYDTAFNVNGATVSTGGFAVPLNADDYNASEWCTLDPLTGDFTLTEGQYYLQGDVVLSTFSTGTKACLVYVAEESALTIAVGNVISGTASIPAAQADLNVTVPFAGELTVPPGGQTYNLVVRSNSANVRLGLAHGISGFSNHFARCGITKIGV